MGEDQQKPNRDREISIAVALGLISLIGALAWTGFILLATAIAGPGDGTADVAEPYFFLVYAGSLYLVLVFVSCLPCVRGAVFARVGIIAHIALLCFAVYFVSQRGGIFPLLPFFGVAAGWMMLFKAKRDTPLPRNEEADKPQHLQ